MNKVIIFMLALIVTSIAPQNARAQAYVDFSKYSGGSGFEDVTLTQVINGETFIAGLTSSPDFPVTNGSVYKANTDLVVTKYGADGSVLYARYLGSPGNDRLYSMKIVNGEVYLLATADSSGYPVTNGTTHRGGIDMVVTKLNAGGGIAFSTYVGGAKGDYPTDDSNNFLIVGNQVIMAGFTESDDYPVTTGSYFGGVRDGFITKINASTGAITRSIFIGGSLGDTVFSLFEENGFIYIVGGTFSQNLPVTIGNSPGTAVNTYAAKLNTGNFAVQYFRYVGGNLSSVLSAAVENGELHLCGFTFARDYPVTNGSGFSGLAGDYIDGFYTRLNENGGIAFATYLGTEGADFQSGKLLLSDGEVFLIATSLSNANPHSWYITVNKINVNGNIAYAKKLSLGLDFQYQPSAVVLNGDLYLAGITKGPDFPVTNGSQFYTGGTGYFTRLDPSGNIVYASFLGRMNALLPLQYANNKFYLLGQSDVASYPVTDGSVIKGGLDNIVAILNPDGSSVFGSYVGGSEEDVPTQLNLYNGDVYLSGRTASADYPVTDLVAKRGINDQFLSRLSFCPVNYNVASDTLSPITQTVCKFGLGDVITGEIITVDSQNLPTVYLNGVAVPQNPLVEASYKWQIATTASGPWTDIPGAIFKDYRPVLGAGNQYFRRLSFTSPACGAALIHISDTASAVVNNLTAPVININGPFSTCPGVAINIGGSPTVSGGNLPYTSFDWDMGAAPVPNPSVSPINNTIYTLTVTDAAGCRQIGQAPVFTYKADAGIDKSVCGNTPVKIGAFPITGVTGILYDWQPGTGLSATNIAQPFANPSAITDYTLFLTVPKSGGGTCVTQDVVRVTPVAAPVTPDFAGPDRVMCLRSSVSLGRPPEAGYNYIWSPGSYLTSNTSSTTTYYAGNILIPTPDPAIINVTAQKDGCSFSDQVIVTTIESRAGFTGCGPRIVGLPERTPGVNEVYSWSKISGSGNFTGATNLPQVPVSASIGSTTIYGLTVSYNGGSCFSQVEVPPVCVGCNVDIRVDARYKCPSFGVNGGDVTLTAISNIPEAVYTWSPQQGLSAYTGNIVQLTDNVPRLYTVTATNINDTNTRCTYQIMVNDPAFSLPLFNAPDVTACANVPTLIGDAPVAGYSYEWTGTGLSNNNISNPTVNIPFATLYDVRITDGNGCELNDAVLVNVQNVQVDAGQDWQVCNNAVIKLGTAPQPGTTYLWEPQSSPWQNGTNQFSAQPEVLAAADVTYTVTATTTAGCVSTDEVNVTINNIPAIPDARDTTACLQSNALIGSPALPGVTYQWTPATGLSNAGIAQPLANPGVTTTYTVLATFPGACATAASDQVTVTVSDLTFNLADITFCPGSGPVALGAGAPLNMASYSWSPSQLVTNPSIANPNTIGVPNSAIIFTLTIVNAAGCSYADNVMISPLTTLPLAGQDKIICKGESTIIGDIANVTGPTISYSWSPATNLSNATAVAPTFTGNTGGIFTYILTKTNNSVSCISRDTVIITVVDLLPVINAPTVCRNSCVQIGTTPVAGALYQWTPATGLSNSTIANPIACINDVPVSYFLTATSFNGCSASATIVVGVSASTGPQVNIPAVTICEGDSNAAFNPVISPAGNYSYLWSPDNGTLSDVNIPNPEITVSGTGSTVFSLQVTDNGSGCTSTGIGTIVINNCAALATIGDYMWFDTNFDGLQDADEPGVSGSLVNLYNSAGFNIATTVTDAGGLYSFTNVQPGDDYYVTFTLPTGFSFTTRNVGGNNATNNSKANANGRTNNFNLTAGQNKLNVDAGILPTGCGPVPVSLLSFTGILQNGKVKLNWQTSAEYNNDYFDVERSNTGNNFAAIGRVNGHGTTQLPHSYLLIDPHPLNGMNYYRLKQVDFDGTGTYSHIVPIKINNDEVISVYYSSADNTIRVNFNKEQDNVQLKLYTNSGQLLRAAKPADHSSAYIFDLPALPTGIYMLQVINNSFTYSKKLFINGR